MNNVYKNINNIQTRLITWGDPFDCNGEDVIVCITGNPGFSEFYIEFASQLYNQTGLATCIIGQAGHEIVPDRQSNILKDQEHLFNLEGQIQHKLDLICNNIDKQSKLHLIGHSIGAWLILKMFQRNNKLINRVSSVNLLFPTIQKMADTKNGVFLNNIIRRFHIILLLIFTIVYMLPEIVRSFLVVCYLKCKSLPLEYKERILKYCNPKVGQKVLFLAYDEMDTVIALDTKVIATIKHFTNVIYSNQDDWAPVHYIEDLSQFEPSICLKEVSVDHAFVLKSSETVADLVSDFIREKMT